MRARAAKKIKVYYPLWSDAAFDLKVIRVEHSQGTQIVKFQNSKNVDLPVRIKTKEPEIFIFG